MACSRPPPPMTMSFMGIPPIDMVCVLSSLPLRGGGARSATERCWGSRDSCWPSHNALRQGGYIIRPYRAGAVIAVHPVGAHCICARGALAIPRELSTTHCGSGGHTCRPYACANFSATIRRPWAGAPTRPPPSPALQGFRRVAGQDVHGLLQDDLPAVGDFVDIVYRRAGDLHAVAKGGLVHL